MCQIHARKVWVSRRFWGRLSALCKTRALGKQEIYKVSLNHLNWMMILYLTELSMETFNVNI
jgi:hypothetical protein